MHRQRIGSAHRNAHVVHRQRTGSARAIGTTVCIVRVPCACRVRAVYNGVRAVRAVHNFVLTS